MKKVLIAGNWKMNNTLNEAEKLVEEILSFELDKDVEALLCVPFTNLMQVGSMIKDKDIKLGAQNIFYEDQGAFTGEISGPMLKSLGVEYVIVGHSERRAIFGEDNQIINKKIKAALRNGIKPVLCCGESLEEREGGLAEDKVKSQIIKALEDIEEESLKDLVIAYEPIWAIGTGLTASSKEANEMVKFIRGIIDEKYPLASKSIRIQYGGSVNPSNIKELMAEEYIDGALVGGASLKAEEFKSLINFRK